MRLLTAFVFILSAAAQSVIVPQITQLTTVVQTVPAAISTSKICVAGPPGNSCLLTIAVSPTASDPYVCEADFTATGQTVTMTDGHGIVWVVGGGVLGSGGSPVGWSYVAPNDTMCRVFPAGLFIQAGGAGVTGHLTVKYNP